MISNKIKIDILRVPFLENVILKALWIIMFIIKKDKTVDFAFVG